MNRVHLDRTCRFLLRKPKAAFLKTFASFTQPEPVAKHLSLPVAESVD
jgi:hypothetical protein